MQRRYTESGIWGIRRDACRATKGLIEWWGIKDSSDEARYTSYPLFRESRIEPPMIWEGEKGQPSKPVMPLDLTVRPIMDEKYIIPKTVDYSSDNGTGGGLAPPGNSSGPWRGNFFTPPFEGCMQKSNPHGVGIDTAWGNGILDETRQVAWGLRGVVPREDFFQTPPTG